MVNEHTPINLSTTWDGLDHFISWDPGDGTPPKPLARLNPQGGSAVFVDREKQVNHTIQSLNDGDSMRLSFGDTVFDSGYNYLVMLPGAGRWLVKANTGVLSEQFAQLYQRIVVIAASGSVSSGRDPYQQKGDTEKVFVFEATRPGWVAIQWLLSNDWANATGDVWLMRLSVEPVADDYGGASAPVIMPDSTDVIRTDTSTSLPPSSTTGSGGKVAETPTVLPPITTHASGAVSLWFETVDDFLAFIRGLQK